MSKYLDSLGIKSVVGFNKWLKSELDSFTSSKQINAVEFEAIKTTEGVIIFWAMNNKLHRHLMKCSVIYVLQEEDLVNAIKEIKSTIKY